MKKRWNCKNQFESWKKKAKYTREGAFCPAPPPPPPPNYFSLKFLGPPPLKLGGAATMLLYDELFSLFEEKMFCPQDI